MQRGDPLTPVPVQHPTALPCSLLQLLSLFSIGMCIAISQLISRMTAQLNAPRAKVSTSKITRKQIFATVKYRKYAPFSRPSSLVMSL